MMISKYFVKVGGSEMTQFLSFPSFLILKIFLNRLLNIYIYLKYNNLITVNLSFFNCIINHKIEFVFRKKCDNLLTNTSYLNIRCFFKYINLFTTSQTSIYNENRNKYVLL